MASMLSNTNLKALVDAAIGRQYRVVGPQRQDELTLMAPLASSGELCLTELTTSNSIKEFFFPQCEKIFSYKLAAKDVTLEETADFPKTLVLGCRPCDGASLERLDRLFGWDTRDSFYFRRREAATVVAIACDRCDESCFCTSVGLTPRSSAGSDVLLVPVAGDGRYLVEAATEKGRAFLVEFASLFVEGKPGAETVASPPVRFDTERVRLFLEANFEHPMWKENFLACLGCGACTYLCPSCHCFDIVDEGSIYGGARLKNWDSCQFALFTRHTSGHNPRSSQDMRWRQRLRHKFVYYPARLAAVSCVGCGRCARECPVGISILDQLVQIDACVQAPVPAGAASNP